MHARQCRLRARRVHCRCGCPKVVLSFERLDGSWPWKANQISGVAVLAKTPQEYPNPGVAHGTKLSCGTWAGPVLVNTWLNVAELNTLTVSRDQVPLGFALLRNVLRTSTLTARHPCSNVAAKLHLAS